MIIYTKIINIKNMLVWWFYLLCMIIICYSCYVSALNPENSGMI